jgi:hypothetical protein
MSRVAALIVRKAVGGSGAVRYVVYVRDTSVPPEGCQRTWDGTHYTEEIGPLRLAQLRNVVRGLGDDKLLPIHDEGRQRRVVALLKPRGSST